MEDIEKNIWMFWVGPRPAWVNVTVRAARKSNSDLMLLDLKTFEEHYYREDRNREEDILSWYRHSGDTDSIRRLQDLSDLVRIYLLKEYGGLWVDTDIFVLRSLQPILDALDHFDFITYSLSGRACQNALVGSNKGGEVVTEVYKQQIAMIKKGVREQSRAVFGPGLLTAVVESCDARGVPILRIPPHAVHPIHWRSHSDFLIERSDEEHERFVDKTTFCYMVTHALFESIEDWTEEQLLHSRTFASYLLRRALCVTQPDRAGEGSKR